ncbi:MAG: alpha/beta fold hydrolase [Candidatus Pacebacteria bacterium]|nr:alpha/beta fold hydrolase [Candidatus Paceibacterota bacterium]
MPIKRVLIIHGWGSNSKEHWFLEEKNRLETKGFAVSVPDMPDSQTPKKDAWLKVIEEFSPDENSILIGHSLGGTAILRYLEKAGRKVGASIIVAAPVRKLGSGFEAIENFLEPNFVWEKIKEKCGCFAIFNQTEDPYVALEHGRDLAGYLGGELVVVEGTNHFDTIDFNLLEKFIF